MKNNTAVVTVMNKNELLNRNELLYTLEHVWVTFSAANPSKNLTLIQQYICKKTHNAVADCNGDAKCGLWLKLVTITVFLL